MSRCPVSAVSVVLVSFTDVQLTFALTQVEGTWHQRSQSAIEDIDLNQLWCGLLIDVISLRSPVTESFS
eukprot:XP_001708690.1 Hypothetical protein GL50803_34828 [Giardia lamblia ATCC 50803]